VCKVVTDNLRICIDFMMKRIKTHTHTHKSPLFASPLVFCLAFVIHK